ncbi:hypothetical protein, partial [Pseudomonas aeruginosa]|uniref:hypothetical protein n=1 Tax=Pseudomonas aeruginosa TaxID=287 RepID=UPI001B2FE442
MREKRLVGAKNNRLTHAGFQPDTQPLRSKLAALQLFKYHSRLATAALPTGWTVECPPQSL